ncbi:hypothetical protein WG66_013469 [Moniliophthora roreri]|nr:hypothetical protein WG66_013469 [Moniliophthora roreri]
MIEIPIDLLPHILSFCDQMSLFRCSSVCRRWRDASRCVLIHDSLVLKINYFTNVSLGWQRLIQSPTRIFEWKYARHLTIILVKDLNNISCITANIVLLHLANEKGVNLQSLSIRSDAHALKFQPLYPKLVSGIASMRLTITHLDVDVQYELLYSMLRLVHTLSNLKVLCLSCSGVKRGEEVSLNGLSLPADLQKLHVRTLLIDAGPGPDMGAASFCDWLNSQTRGGKKLKYLSILDHNNLAISEALIRLSPTTLETLFMSFKGTCMGCRYIETASLTNLRYVIISTPSLPSRAKCITLFATTVYQTLRRIHSIYLQEIIFIIPLRALDYANVWVPLDRLFSADRFSTVQCITLAIPSDSWGGRTHESVISGARQQFTRCLATGRKLQVKSIQSGLDETWNPFEQDRNALVL